MIIRGQEAVIPQGDTVLQDGDVLVMNELNGALASEPSAGQTSHDGFRTAWEHLRMHFLTENKKASGNPDAKENRNHGSVPAVQTAGKEAGAHTAENQAPGEEAEDEESAS